MSATPEPVRVWLTPWEWACCGDPFVVGDRVELLVARDADRSWIAERLGGAFASTVDAVESHHDRPGLERLTGHVVAIHAALGRERMRRVPRPARAPRPPLVLGTAADGKIVSVGSAPPAGLSMSIRPEPFVWTHEPVPAEADLRPLPRIPPPEPEGAAEEALVEGEASIVVGYVVDLTP